MNTKQKTGIALIAIIFGLVLSPALATNEAAAIAPNLTFAETPDTFYKRGALTAPSDDKPFGGDVVVNYFLRVNDHNIKVNVDFWSMPSSGMVYEGWLVDVDTGYKLSLGQFNTQSDGLFFEQDIVNPWIYNVLVITEEPVDDTNPAPNMPVGGVPLSEPFGQ